MKDLGFEKSFFETGSVEGYPRLVSTHSPLVRFLNAGSYRSVSPYPVEGSRGFYTFTAAGFKNFMRKPTHLPRTLKGAHSDFGAVRQFQATLDMSGTSQKGQPSRLRFITL